MARPRQPKTIKAPKVTGFRQGLDAQQQLATRKAKALAPFGKVLHECIEACDGAHYDGSADEVKAKKAACRAGCIAKYDAAAGPIEAMYKPAEAAIKKDLEKNTFDEVVIHSKGQPFKSIAKRLYPKAAKFLEVGDKSDLVAALHTDWRVRTLRLFVESGDGSFYLGPNQTEVTISSVANALKSQKYRMYAIFVDMNSCNGASSQGLTRLLELTDLLDDGRDGTYWAWNKFHFFQWITVTLPTGVSSAALKEMLRKRLAYTDGYRVEGEAGPDQIATSTRRTVRILVEWFSEDHSQVFRKLPTTRTSQTERDYQRIAEQQEVPVRGKAEAAAYELKHESTPIHLNLDHVRLRGIYNEH